MLKQTCPSSYLLIMTWIDMSAKQRPTRAMTFQTKPCYIKLPVSLEKEFIAKTIN